jgi:hypothetical protein
MGLFSIALDFIQDQSAKQIVQEALQESFDVMESMIGNEGQQSVYENYVQEAFYESAQGDIENGWEEVDIGEYMEFMGEIVAEGNNIMSDAYEYANEVLAESADFSEEE